MERIERGKELPSEMMSLCMNGNDIRYKHFVRVTPRDMNGLSLSLMGVSVFRQQFLRNLIAKMKDTVK